MCQKINRRHVKTPSVACMFTVVVVLAVFLSTESVAGSCLSYGHACWGAHGKRNGDGGQVKLPRIANGNNDGATSKGVGDDGANDDEAKAEWFLSKILNPLDLRNYRDGNDLMDAAPAKSQPEIGDNLFTDLEAKSDKRVNGWDRIRDMDNFFKSPKFVEKRSTTDK